MLYVYRGSDCPHETEVFCHSFSESKTYMKCPECGNQLGRVITGSHRVWAPPLKNRLKKWGTRFKNADYARNQAIRPNREKHIDMGARRGR